MEPTTGAPVDAVPRRVPVRQQSRLQREGRSDGDTPDDDSAFWAPIEEVHWDGTRCGRTRSRPGTAAFARWAAGHRAVRPDRPIRCPGSPRW